MISSGRGRGRQVGRLLLAHRPSLRWPAAGRAPLQIAV